MTEVAYLKFLGCSLLSVVDLDLLSVLAALVPVEPEG